MKSIKVLALSLFFVASYSCKEQKKEAKELKGNSEEIQKDVYSIVNDSTAIKFTAYKTTDKKPVGGIFKTINIKSKTTGATPNDIINGLEFSIPVSSLFTNDATGTRDPKLIEFFFKKMVATEFITGAFSLDANDKLSVDLKLNGISTKLDMDYTVVDNSIITLNGVLNLENWDALDALATLNKACEALHTGADGVSKTWNDVAIEASILLKKN